MNERYFQDDDDGTIIRFTNHHKTEIYNPIKKRWVELPPDNSYMRGLYLGQGKWWITAITKEKAENIIGKKL